MARTIRVFEYEKLTIRKDDQDRFLTSEELVKLYDFNDKNGQNYFVGIRDGIKFKNYVGVIQIGGLTIEILPKTDRNKSTETDYNNWHSALLDMLKVCNHISVSAVSEASLKRKYNSILDLYFSMYLTEVERLIRQGLIKSYRKNEGNVKALKGRLEFSKHIQSNLIHKERFYTTHEIYDYDNLINQILYKAMYVVNTLSNSPIISDRVKRVKASFPEISQVEINAGDFLRIKENRKNIAYSKALQIARMIILNYSPDIRSGQENMLTLLFDMNKLWEEYIYKMLLKVKGDKWSINSQTEQKFWENRRIKPDLVIRDKQTEDVFIIDTKWKILTGQYPQPSDDDLKQMYAYNMYWDAEKSILLYPKSNESSEPTGNFHKGRDGVNQCKVGFINVLNRNGKLDYGIGNAILEKLN